MREFFTIAIFKIKADIRMNKTTLNSQKEKHSMLSLRRATGAACRLHPPWCHFYPRSPRGERRLCLVCQWRRSLISIHALLAESDSAGVFWPRGLNHFYPRSPCGERPHADNRACKTAKFLSTLSLRRATPTARLETIANTFLSTLSLRRATKQQAAARRAAGNFYPRSPCGERRLTQTRLAELSGIFLSTLSLRRATGAAIGHRMPQNAFLSTLSLRRATRTQSQSLSA